MSKTQFQIKTNDSNSQPKADPPMAEKIQKI